MGPRLVVRAVLVVLVVLGAAGPVIAAGDDDSIGYDGSDYDPGGSGSVTDSDGADGSDDDDDADAGGTVGDTSEPSDDWIEPETSLSERSGDNQVAPGGGNATGNASQNGTGGGAGGLLSWFGSMSSALANPMETFQDWARKVVEMLTARPVPTRNGEPAWFGNPDGEVMSAVFDSVWSMAVPLGIILAILFAIIAAGMYALLPPSVVPERMARGELYRQGGKMVHVLLSVPIMVGWLVLCQAVARWAAPTGDQMFPGGQALVETTVSGGLAGVLLWVSSGVLAALVILVWALGWAGAVLGPVLYPAFVGADPPDLPVIRKFKMLTNTGFILAMIAMPVPTAVVLGAGYPVINGLRQSTDGVIAELGGLALTPVLILLLWFVALVLPLVLLVSARQMRPAAMFAAGVLGTASVMSAANRANRLRPSMGSAASAGSSVSSGAGATVDPLEGSPFQRSTDGGEAGGALGGGSSGGGAAALGGGSAGGAAGSGMAGGAPASVAESGGPPAGAAGAGGSTGSGSGASGGSTAMGGPGGAGVQQVSDPSEIPADQQYEIGVDTDTMGWSTAEDTTYSREWLLEDGAFERMQGAYGGELKMRGAQSGQTYDVSEITHGDHR